MKHLISIVVFALALFVGSFCVPKTTPMLYETIYPGFSYDEASAFMGKRLKNKYVSPHYKSGACPPEKGFCRIIEPEEEGTVVDIFKTKDNRYFLMIKWDKDTTPMYSYSGRFSSRLFNEFE